MQHRVLEADAGDLVLASRDNLRGVLVMVAAMLALTLNFAFVKVTSPLLPTGEILFLRGLIAGAMIAVVVLWTGAHRRLRLVLHRTVVWRTASECASAVFYFLALFQMPIGSATVLYQALPLVLTAAAAIFLGEQVQLRRWVAILAGFVGVLVVIRPGASAYDEASLLMLLAILCSVGRDLATRSIPTAIPSILVTMVALFTLSFVGLLGAMAEDWIAPNVFALLMLTAASALLVVGLLCLVTAMRAGELSVISPFRYSSVVWAVALDYLIWNQVIDFYMAAGAAIIVASGIYISYPGRRAAMRATPEGAL